LPRDIAEATMLLGSDGSPRSPAHHVGRCGCRRRHPHRAPPRDQQGAGLPPSAAALQHRYPVRWRTICACCPVPYRLKKERPSLRGRGARANL